MFWISLLHLIVSNQIYSICIKSDSSNDQQANELVESLTEAIDKINHFLTKSNEIHQNYCEDKEWFECQEAIPYRASAYVLANTIHISIFQNSMPEFHPNTTHLIIVLLKNYPRNDYLDLSRLRNQINVTVVGIKSNKHFLYFSNSDWSSSVNNLFLESIVINNERLDYFGVGTMILDSSIIKTPLKTAFFNLDTHIFMNTNSLSNIGSSSLKHVSIFTDNDLIDKINIPNSYDYHVCSNDTSFFAPYIPSKQNQTIYTQSNSLQINFQSKIKQISIRFQQIHHIKMRAIFECILNFNDDQFSSSSTINMEKSNEFILRVNGTLVNTIELYLPIDKELKIVDFDYFPVPSSKYQITRLNIDQPVFAFDCIDLDNIEPYNYWIGRNLPPSSESESFYHTLGKIPKIAYYCVVLASILVLVISCVVVICYLHHSDLVSS